MNTPDMSVYEKVEQQLRPSWVPLAMTGKSAGKRPVETDWQKWCEERRPLAAINYAWSLGIATGPASGLLVADIDNNEQFEKLCEKKNLVIHSTFTVRTGSGGVHYYYGYPKDGQRYGNRSYRINVETEKIGVFDVRGIGGQIVAPGSVHLETGNLYEIIDNADIADAPQWLIDYSLTGNLGGEAKQPTPAATPVPTTANIFDWDHSIDQLPIKPETKNLIISGVEVGGRSEAMMTVINALVWSGLTNDDIVGIFEQYSIGEKYRSAGHTRERWLLKQIEKARAYVTDRADYDNGFTRNTQCPADSKTKFRKNDHLGPAKGIVESYGQGNIIYAGDNFFWLWSDSVWERIDDREVKAKIPQVIGSKTITRGFVDAVADMAKTEAFNPKHRFDITMEGVNCQNGEVVYQGGEFVLQPHCREHFRTSLIPVDYDPKATAPRFNAFLMEIFEGDPDHIEKACLVLEVIGYTLQSHCRYEKFVLLVGPGANGKSVLMDAVTTMLGGRNVCAVGPNQFENRFQRAYLHCKLANMVTEIPEGHVIADAALKAIVSGELTTAEHKHKPPFDFKPYCTCWFGTNHMPHTRDFSDALFRRAIIIPFNRVFTEFEQDKKLKEKLVAELPGILRLSLEAFAGVIQRGGFTQTESTEQAKRDWRLESDQAAQFIGECCETIPDAQEPSSAIYSAYREWVTDNGISRPLGKRTFTNRLGRLGCVPVKGVGGTRMISGIKINQSLGGGFRSLRHS